jgi:hypothetical protein
VSSRAGAFLSGPADEADGFIIVLPNSPTCNANNVGAIRRKYYHCVQPGKTGHAHLNPTAAMTEAGLSITAK